MHTIAKKFGVLLLAIVFALGLAAPVSAQTSTTTSTSTAEELAALLQQIAQLQAQINELQSKLGSVQQELREAVALTRNLSLGMTGEDVEALQKLLASDPELYPEGLVTGYFGPLTERAVERLQARFGIEQVGNVGPITRGTLNQLFKHINSGKGSLNRGPGNIFDRLELDQDDTDVDLSEFVPGTKGIKVCHIPRGNPAAAHTIAVGGPAVRAHLAHGDTLGECDDEDENDEEDEDENDDENEDEDDAMELEIDDVDESNVASTTAMISWTTSTSTTGTVYYSTVTPVVTDADDTESALSDELDTEHEVTLENLEPDTKYYYVIVAKDESDNEVTSDEESFETDEEDEGY